MFISEKIKDEILSELWDFEHHYMPIHKVLDMAKRMYLFDKNSLTDEKLYNEYVEIYGPHPEMHSTIHWSTKKGIE